MPRAFGGVRLFRLPADQLILSINMLVQHYGTSSILGHKLQSSLKCLQLEIGAAGNPLKLDYEIYKDLVIPC